MKVKKHPVGIWILTLSAITCVLLITGWVLAVSDIVWTPKTKTNKPITAKVTQQKTNNLLLGLGDSLTRGEGDEQGLGYFGLVRDDLKKKNLPGFTSTNLAISGQNSIQLRQQVDKVNVQKLISQARWITMTIGGNDLNRGSGDRDEIDEAAAKKSQAIYLTNLDAILQLIQRTNPNTTLFLFGLYNPFGDLKDSKQTNRIISEWNESIRQTIGRYPYVVVVPTFDLFQLQPKRYLYTDVFHPNHDGYVRMTTRLLQVIRDTTVHKELLPS